MNTLNSKLLELPSLKGKLCLAALPAEEDERGEVVLAGDPNGLRSLAELLLSVAELDQSLMANLPESESEHIQLRIGVHLGRNSISETDLIVSRLDCKDGSTKGYYRGEVEEERPVLERRIME